MRISIQIAIFSLLALLACNSQPDSETESEEEDDGLAMIVGSLDDESDSIEEAEDPTQIAGTNLTSTERSAKLYRFVVNEQGALSVDEIASITFTGNRFEFDIEPYFYHVVVVDDGRRVTYPPALPQDTKAEIYIGSVLNSATTASAILLSDMAARKRGVALINRGVVDLGLIYSTAVVVGPNNILGKGLSLTGDSIKSRVVDELLTANEKNVEKSKDDQATGRILANLYGVAMTTNTAESTGGFSENSEIDSFNNFVTAAEIESIDPKAGTATVQAKAIAKIIAADPVAEAAAKDIWENIATADAAEAIVTNAALDSAHKQNNAAVLAAEEAEKAYEDIAYADLEATYEAEMEKYTSYYGSLEAEELEELVQASCDESLALVADELDCDPEPSPQPTSEAGQTIYIPDDEIESQGTTGDGGSGADPSDSPTATPSPTYSPDPSESPEPSESPGADDMTDMSETDMDDTGTDDTADSGSTDVAPSDFPEP